MAASGWLYHFDVGNSLFSIDGIVCISDVHHSRKSGVQKMKWLLGVLLNAVLFMALAGYFHNQFELANFRAALEASFMLSILNVLVRPLLILLTLPATILTMGFFLFVINAITLEITDALMGPSFEISGFGMALLASIVMAAVNLIVQKTLFEPKSRSEK